MAVNMFDAVRRWKLVAAFASARGADYAELLALEWAELSRSLVRLVCGGVVALLGSLFFLGFFSIAVIVSAWESDWRVLTAWLVALAWFGVCAGGGVFAWTAIRHMRPFEHVRDELSKDVAVVRTAL